MHRYLFILLGLAALAIVACKSETTSSKGAEVEVAPVEVKEQKRVTTRPETKASQKEDRAELLAQTIMLNQINYGWINERLLEKVNAERRRLGLSIFTYDGSLGRAARSHNNYMVSANVLDHKQVGTDTPEMKDRLKKANSKMRTAGENIQYEGFTIRTVGDTESIIAPTYEALCEQLWQNWKTSPPHYKNIINPEFSYMGTALKWSDERKAIFVTQLYGGD